MSTGLPPGITLSPAGVFSGTPTVAGTYDFTVQVTDANGATASAPMEIVVAPALVLTISGVPGAVQGQAFTFTLKPTGGQPPFQFVQE